MSLFTVTVFCQLGYLGISQHVLTKRIVTKCIPGPICPYLQYGVPQDIFGYPNMSSQNTLSPNLSQVRHVPTYSMVYLRIPLDIPTRPHKMHCHLIYSRSNMSLPTVWCTLGYLGISQHVLTKRIVTKCIPGPICPYLQYGVPQNIFGYPNTSSKNTLSPNLFQVQHVPTYSMVYLRIPLDIPTRPHKMHCHLIYSRSNMSLPTVWCTLGYLGISQHVLTKHSHKIYSRSNMSLPTVWCTLARISHVLTEYVYPRSTFFAHTCA